MRLCCSQTPEDRFSRVDAHIRSSQEESTNLDICSDDDIMGKNRQQKVTDCGCQSKCLSMFKNGEHFENILQMREIRKEEKDVGKLKCKGTSYNGMIHQQKGKGIRFILLIVKFVKMRFCSHMT